MVRSHNLARVIPGAALLLLAIPLATGQPVEAAPARSAVLAIPKADLQRRAVPVIIELNTPAPTAVMNQYPGLVLLLNRLRDQLLNVLRVDHASAVQTFHIIPAIAATVNGIDLPALAKESGVRAIVPDQRRAMLPLPAHSALGVTSSLTSAVVGRSSPVVDEPVSEEPESFSLTRANLAQARGYNGSGIRVAIIDSGLDINQPDLRGTVATDANGVPLRVDFTGTDLQDTLGHGTACASMIVAQGRSLYAADTTFTSSNDHNAPTQIYPPTTGRQIIYRSHFHVHGMAPGVRVMSAKIFDTRAPFQGGLDSWIVRAIQWAVDHHADVISESFGGFSLPSNGTDPTALADEAAVQAGITVVVAAGNEGPGQTTIASPAVAPGVIAVGASTQFRHFGQAGFLAPYGRTTADNIASFTSRGPTSDGRPRPDLVAPGAFNWALFPTTKSDEGATFPPYDVNTFGGTSEATPVTAGAAALVIQAFRQSHGGSGPSPALVRSILMSSAHDLGYPASDQGAGRVDAWEAVQTATRGGPSFLIGPNSLAVAGPVAAPFSARFAITNTGYTAEHITLDAVQSHQIGIQEWGGTVQSTELHPFKFTVAPGLERVEGSVSWDSSDRFQVRGSTQLVALRVALYDPLGRFVNYSYGVGSGFAAAQAIHPMPGTWTLVISENGRKDAAGFRHFTRADFQARLSTFVTVPYGSVSPAAVSLAPGASASISLNGHTPIGPGVQVVTVHVHGDHTVAVPVVLTSYITLQGPNASFGGVFTGASTDYASFQNQNEIYSVNVPAGTRALDVSLSWPDQGYGVYLLLMDPSGRVVDTQYNIISNGNRSDPFDLSLHNLEALWSSPSPGRWQIVVVDAVYSGQQRAEPFSGRLTLNDDAVLPITITHAGLPGSTFELSLQVRNDNGPNVAEGYVGYATSDQYGVVPLGSFTGPFGNSHSVTGTDVYTYTTGFVPPGARRVVSSIAVVKPSVTADLSFSDPSYFGPSEGVSNRVRIAGRVYDGTTASISGPELPIGPWNGVVTLRRPFNTHTLGTIIGTSYAEALKPEPWITFDHGLQNNGFITGGQPLILLPGQHDALHATVTLPLGLQPGIYHYHLFVYTVFVDQLADIPFTLIVQSHSGTEPAGQTP